MDVDICEGKVYFLTCNAKFGELKWSLAPIVQPLETKIKLIFSLQLVTSNKCPFIISDQSVFDVDTGSSHITLVGYMLDAFKLEWSVIDNMDWVN